MAEGRPPRMGIDFSTIDGVVCDMDGVLWHGEQPLPGLVDFFTAIRRQALPVALATNNSSKSGREYVDKLRRLGVDGIPETAVITSRTAMVDYLLLHYAPPCEVYVIGTSGLADAIREAGYRVGDAASVVVVGIDLGISYDKLKRATLLIRGGAAFLGTNGDASVPAAEGLVPGNGAILAALEAATGRAPVVVGKPSPPMFDSALRVLGTAPARTLMVGDRLDTDIAGARASGLATALVLSGATSRHDLAGSAIQPDGVFGGLPDLLAAWTDGTR